MQTHNLNLNYLSGTYHTSLISTVLPLFNLTLTFLIPLGFRYSLLAHLILILLPESKSIGHHLFLVRWFGQPVSIYYQSTIDPPAFSDAINITNSSSESPLTRLTSSSFLTLFDQQSAAKWPNLLQCSTRPFSCKTSHFPSEHSDVFLIKLESFYFWTPPPYFFIVLHAEIFILLA